MTLRALRDAFREPIRPEAKHALRASWESLPAAFRTGQQMFGRQGNPCGATIGSMPRCDFACRGCYLGDGANHVPALPVEAVKRQMRQLRPLLGSSGNLQLTDGEVTLRPEAQQIELLRYADAIGLIPMLMTHGDSFRRRPGLLERLMDEGGLREISIHVDATMRGRTGAAYKDATTEAALNPLREEFADMIRAARKKTGRPLVAATTMTITRDNLAGVADAVRCVVKQADAFKMLSFQPIAQVGRTEAGLGGGVGLEELWTEAARGLGGPASNPAFLMKGQMWLGHSACNRYVHGFVLAAPGRESTFHPLRMQGDRVDERSIERYLARYGGASFRRDAPATARARLLGLIAQDPRFWLAEVLPYLWHQASKMGDGNAASVAWQLVRGRARVHHFNIVSHSFMSPEELHSPLGRERLDLCVFRVPIGDELVSMCEVNALGVRDRYYAEIRAGQTPGLQSADATAFQPLGRRPAFSPSALPLRVI